MEIDPVNPAHSLSPPTTMSSNRGPSLSVEQLAAGLEKMMVNENGEFGSGLFNLSVEKLRDLEKQAIRFLATIRSARNQTRPVNRLPPEVFVKVLEVRVKDRDLDAAIQVCARWRAILTSMPYLWTKVDFEYPTRASLYLERSKGYPVDVVVGKTRDTIIGPVGTFIGATPWVARMKSISIETDMEQIKKIAERLCQKAPRLESLTFEGKARRYSYSSYGSPGTAGAIYVPREFLGRQAPLLRSLTFRSVSPSVVFNFPMPNLTKIDWVAETAHVVIEELLELFANCPLLEDVTMNVLIRRTQMHEPLKQVTLNNLRRLEWGDHDGCLSPIPCITAPQLRDLAVKLTFNTLCQRPTLTSFLSSDKNRIPLLTQPSVVEYTYRSGVRMLRCRYGGAAFLLIREAAKDRVTDPPVSHWFPPDMPLDFTAVQELNIETSGGCPLVDDVPITHFESLRKLCFLGTCDPLVALIPLVPSPRLSEIRINPREHYFPLEKVTEAIKKRHELGVERVKTLELAGKDRFLRGNLLELGKVVKVL